MTTNNPVLRRKQRVSGRLSKWLSRKFIDEKLNNWVGWILFGLLAVSLGYLMAAQMTVGASILGIVIGICLVIPVFASSGVGLAFVFIYNLYIYVVPRLTGLYDLKVGIGYDALLICTLLGFVLRREGMGKGSAELFRTPVMIWTTVLYIWTALEIANPLAHSFQGWYVSFRVATESFLLFIISYHVMKSQRRINQYLAVLFWASFFCALYGCITQWHGIFPFERAYIGRLKGGSVYYAGQVRIFSTASGPTGFGMDMAGAAVMFIILGLNEKRKRLKWTYFFGVVIMILGSTYSGTRTSNIMLIAGLGVYILLNFDKKQTRMFAGAMVLLLLIVIKLPYYSNPTLNRFRSTFEGKHDESYLVREVNRKRIQPYIYTHPMGGGLGTTNAQGLVYNPGHPLADFQTDDGYLKTALEIGSIGLLITCILYFCILRMGVREYFRTDKPRNRAVLASCLACLFSFMLADLAQEGINEITNVAIFYPVIAIMLRMNYVT